MPLGIPWDGVTCKGILVGFLLAGIIGFLANRILWKFGVKPIRAFFQPQAVVQQTKKSPFQVYLGCLTGVFIVATVSIIILGLLAWMSGASGEYSASTLLGDLIRFASDQTTTLLFVGFVVVIIVLALRASGREKKEE